MKKNGIYHPEHVTLHLSNSLRAALDQRVQYTRTDSLAVYIREVLENHMADLRAAKRVELPDYVYSAREPVEEGE